MASLKRDFSIPETFKRSNPPAALPAAASSWFPMTAGGKAAAHLKQVVHHELVLLGARSRARRLQRRERGRRLLLLLILFPWGPDGGSRSSSLVPLAARAPLPARLRWRPKKVVLVVPELIDGLQDVTHSRVRQPLLWQLPRPLREPSPAEDLDRADVHDLVVEVLHQPRHVPLQESEVAMDGVPAERDPARRGVAP